MCTSYEMSVATFRRVAKYVIITLWANCTFGMYQGHTESPRENHMNK